MLDKLGGGLRITMIARWLGVMVMVMVKRTYVDGGETMMMNRGFAGGLLYVLHVTSGVTD